jgi:transcriptional regulator with XRE-family HTH domain
MRKQQVDAEAFERYTREHGRCLGIAVCQLRAEKGLTLDQLAKPAEVSALWLRRLETNQLHTNYSIGRLDRIARALGVELYHVYKRADEMLGPPPWLDKEEAQSDE